VEDENDEFGWISEKDSPRQSVRWFGAILSSLDGFL
jgi:hypothetical protein